MKLLTETYLAVGQNLTNPSDFHNFIFGTKSKTLANLKGQLEFSKFYLKYLSQ